MGEHRSVTVEGVRLRFASAHMATLGDELEPLHGHNYSVRCRVGGELTPDRWLIDFSLLKRYVRKACEQLDHRLLLQRDSSLLDISKEDDGWLVVFGQRRYRFPRADAVLLPVENTTAELIAQWLCDRVIAALEAHGHSNISRVAVDVEEMPGQSGGYEREIGTGGRGGSV